MKVTQVQLARRLNVSRARVSTMVKTGLITTDDRGLIDLDMALTTIASNSDPSKGGKNPQVRGDFYEHRTRKEAALAALREMEADEKKGSLVDASDLERELAKLFTDVKTQLRGLPVKLAGELYNMAISASTTKEGQATIFKKLLLEIDAALLELSHWKGPTAAEKQGNSAPAKTPLRGRR